MFNEEIPVGSLNEIKSVLVSALAFHGQLCDAFGLYEEIKQAGSKLEPKAIIYLIVSSLVVIINWSKFLLVYFLTVWNAGTSEWEWLSPLFGIRI